MLLHKSIIETISPEGISGLYFMTKEYEKLTIGKRICEIFNSQWLKQCKIVQMTYGNCFEMENRWPSGIDMYVYPEGVLVTFPALYILYNKGLKSDMHAGIEAFEQTLNLIQNEYPDVKYYGYIGFVDLDNNVYQKEIASEEGIRVDRYEFIADAIGKINDEIDKYIDNLRDFCCYEESSLGVKWIWDVVNVFHLYEDKISLSIYNMIMSTAYEYIEEDDEYEYELVVERIAEWKEAARYTDPDDDNSDNNS